MYIILRGQWFSYELVQDNDNMHGYLKCSSVSIEVNGASRAEKY